MTPTNPAPDGTTLHVRDWPPEQTPWLHLVLVHGLGEQSGRYDGVGRRLAEAGLAVRAYDHRGHGASPGRRGDVDSWSDLTGDVGRMVDDVRARAVGGPVALMGHSMGGLIVLDSVLSGVATPDLLVLSSPALADGLPAWQHFVAPLVARVWPTLGLANAWDPDVLSRDPAVGQAVADDPLMLERATARLGSYGFAAQDRVNAGIDQLGIPTYVTHGDADQLVPPEATEALGDLPGVTRVLYPGLRHETLFEPEGPQVVDGIVEWLRANREELEPAS